MQVKYLLTACGLVELLDRNPIGVKGFHDRVAESLNGCHDCRYLLRTGIQHIAAGGFGNNQQMTVGPRHDIHECKRFVILVNARGGDFATQEFRKNIVWIISCHAVRLRLKCRNGCAACVAAGQACRHADGTWPPKRHPPPATIILDPDQTPPLKALAGRSKTTFESKAARTDFLWPFVMQQEAP